MREIDSKCFQLDFEERRLHRSEVKRLHTSHTQGDYFDEGVAGGGQNGDRRITFESSFIGCSDGYQLHKGENFALRITRLLLENFVPSWVGQRVSVLLRDNRFRHTQLACAQVVVGVKPSEVVVVEAAERDWRSVLEVAGGGQGDEIIEHQGLVELRVQGSSLDLM